MVTTYHAPPSATDAGLRQLTVGVEEEFLLLDPDTGVNAAVAEAVIDNLPEAVRGQSRLELRRSMVEMVTPVCTDLLDLAEVLARHRRMAASAADTAGARLVAVGATPVDDPQRDVPEDELAGAPTSPVRDCEVAAAHWRAAREGLDGALMDLRLGTLRPAWDLVDELMATVSPALLRHGDVELVVRQLARLRRHGTGATRQRDVHARTGHLRAVLADLAEQTVVGMTDRM
jgi:gamma-glutamyl:cysteine ligase YbdK (ATP-grasp superfamily)